MWKSDWKKERDSLNGRYIRDLVECMLPDIDDVNYDIAVDFCENNIKEHSYLSIDKRHIAGQIKG